MNNTKKNTIEIDWDKMEFPFSGLNTDRFHEIIIKRETIPIIFVPGIMGSVLRRRGTNGVGSGTDSLPNLRWDPGRSFWMVKNYSGESGVHRRSMLVGPGSFDGNYLEVHNTQPIGNGYQGVSKSDYHSFLRFIQNQSNWGPLNKIFEFPVFAFGYNWTDTNFKNGELLSKRIDEIINEAHEVSGNCEKVILITHSMGGLVARSASHIYGAESNILGIIHGVQPSFGSAAAYWRVKSGFEGSWFGSNAVGASKVLGPSGREVTPLLGSVPGGLELLPNKQYTTNGGQSSWLTLIEDSPFSISLPNTNPYSEIYRIQGTGNETQNPTRKYWGLIDPDLLEAAFNMNQSMSGPDLIRERSRVSGWDHYLEQLRKAENFHDQLKNYVHPKTYTFHGIGHNSADRIELRTETFIVRRDSYPNRGFRGYYEREKTNKKGQIEMEEVRAEIQNGAGDGDGTVPVSSASFLDNKAQTLPAPIAINLEHQPAYKEKEVRNFVVSAIVSMCIEKYEKKMGKKIKP